MNYWVWATTIQRQSPHAIQGFPCFHLQSPAKPGLEDLQQDADVVVLGTTQNHTRTPHPSNASHQRHSWVVAMTTQNHTWTPHPWNFWEATKLWKAQKKSQHEVAQLGLREQSASRWSSLQLAAAACLCGCTPLQTGTKKKRNWK